LLNDAREAADAVIESLREFVAQGIPIIGLEPSCILSFRDEYPALSSHSHRHSLAQLALTFEEFVARHSSQFETALQHHSISPVLLHGHCHQKAQVGTKPAHIALQLAGYAVTEVDSGCCGMAGSFGYEADHYAISKQMAERALVPAVRNASNDTLIVAAGVSCRQQIKDLSGQAALHPAEALQLRLK
jgi:Fe-S oxidoreductase